MSFYKTITVLLAAGAFFHALAGEMTGTEEKNSAPFFKGIATGCTVRPDQGMTCTVQKTAADGLVLSFRGKVIRPADAGKKSLIHRGLTVQIPQPCNFTGKTLTFEYRIKGPVKNIVIKGEYQGKTIFLYSNWAKQFSFWRLVDLETGLTCDYFHLKQPMGDASKIDTLKFSLGTDVPDADIGLDFRNLRLTDTVY